MAMQQIKHVIYYMLENRSFDNLLGWLYDDDEPVQLIAGEKLQDQPFYGLKENTYFNCFAGDDTKHYVAKGTATLNTPNPDPFEPYIHMNYQLFGNNDKPVEGQTPNMSGYLSDYARLSGIKESSFADKVTAKLWSGTNSKEDALQVLHTYTPQQLPIINGLAKHYAVSDHWFASVPSQTNCNRAFSICGTSEGLVNNANGPFKSRNIWDVLCENGYNTPDDWMIYYQSKTAQFSWKFWDDLKYCYTEETFVVPDQKNHVANIDQFFEQAKQGKLPAFSYLEPDWIGIIDGLEEEASNHIGTKEPTTPNSFHPPSEVQSGEQFLKKLYEVMNSTPEAREAWKSTVLIITFDENGGIFDHVPPPWGATPPWGDSKPDFELEEGFNFDRFGVRIPTILVSPWVDEKTVFRSLTDVPYDHTSTIATILNWKGIDKSKWNMGERVANAPTWDNVLNRKTPREEFPSLDLAADCEQVQNKAETPVSPMQALMLPKILNKASGGHLSDEQIQQHTDDMLASSDNIHQLHKKIIDFADGQ